MLRMRVSDFTKKKKKENIFPIGKKKIHPKRW